MGAGGLVGPPHHIWARSHLGPRPHRVWGPGGSPQVPSGLRKLPELLFTEEKISPDFDDIFHVGFLKPKIAENMELTLWHLVNRLAPENG